MRIISIVITIIAMIGGNGALAADKSDDGAKLCVMTFNLRYASDKPPHAWPTRRPIMAECIHTVSPDLIGTQEGLYRQLKDMAADLPEYSWIGLGREGGSRGEFMAVFYKKARFEPLEFDHFWLSDTPLVMGSTTWGNSNRRMVTWVRFLDRQTQKQFYFFNTHLDHEIEMARQKSASLIRQRIDALKTTLPVLLVGDFNTEPTSPARKLLTENGGLTDSWQTATERKGESVHTFHDYKGPVKSDDRIDWILYQGPVKVDATQIITFSKDNEYPSDHFPLVAWMRLAEK